MNKWHFSSIWIFLGLLATLSINIFTFPISTYVGANTISSRTIHSSHRSLDLRNNVANLSSLRGVNYYPSSNGWYYMWTNWNSTIMNNDFAKIATVLHANYVRIIVPADKNFGYPIPHSSMLDELSKTITSASSYGLKVDLTLFDLFQNYTDIASSRQWINTVLNSYRDDPRIAFIDLQNELDNHNSSAVTWARAILPYAHSLIGNIPITISVSGAISNLALQVAYAIPIDFYEFHYYLDASMSYSVLQQAQRLIGGLKPLVIGEIGYSTIKSNTFLSGLSKTQESQEAEQDQYIRTVEYAARQLGLPFASPWNYSDFTDNANVLNGYLGTTQQFYGLYRKDGTIKPAGSTIASIFNGQPINTSFNNSFENCDTANLPTLWRIYQDSTQGFIGSFTCDSSFAHTGSKSVRISNSLSSKSGTPGFYLSPIQYIATNESYTVTVWARGANVTGNSHVSLSWYDINHVYLGKDVSPNLPKGNTSWTQLSLTATPLANAVAVEIHLETEGINTGTVWFDDVTFQSNFVPRLPKRQVLY